MPTSSKCASPSPPNLPMLRNALCSHGMSAALATNQPAV